MKVYERGPVLDAHQWWRNGDHPDDNSKRIERWGGRWISSRRAAELTMGEVVGFYAVPITNNPPRCGTCDKLVSSHGRLKRSKQDPPQSDRPIVCPGDWIITHPPENPGGHKTYSLCRRADFQSRYFADPVARSMDESEPADARP